MLRPPGVLQRQASIQAGAVVGEPSRLRTPGAPPPPSLPWAPLHAQRCHSHQAVAHLDCASAPREAASEADTAVAAPPPRQRGSEGVPRGAQRGNFPAAQRLVTFLYRGLQFSIIGFFASVVGHSATKFLVPYPTASFTPTPHPPSSFPQRTMISALAYRARFGTIYIRVPAPSWLMDR